MAASAFEDLLDKVQQQMSVVRSALLGDDPVQLESSSQRLQQMVADLYRMHEQLAKMGQSPKKLTLRMKELSASLNFLREGLLRKSAYVDQALKVILPENPDTTYAPKSGPYGSGIRKSGKFGGFSA
jgi:hypothetical protein